MSIWTHKEEVIRLLDSPDNTRVWYRDQYTVWSKVNNPSWLSKFIYVVDDIHAKMRRDWIDKGKPQIEYYDNFKEEWMSITGEPSWDIEIKYRFKLPEWETPHGEDPIKYHAKRLGSDSGEWYIVIGEDRRYYITHAYNIPIGAVMMEAGVANTIVNALNEGELKL